MEVYFTLAGVAVIFVLVYMAGVGRGRAEERKLISDSDINSVKDKLDLAWRELSTYSCCHIKCKRRNTVMAFARNRLEEIGENTYKGTLKNESHKIADKKCEEALRRNDDNRSDS